MIYTSQKCSIGSFKINTRSQLVSIDKADGVLNKKKYATGEIKKPFNIKTP